MFGLLTALTRRNKPSKEQPSPLLPEWERWFEGKEFTKDWATHRFPIWARALAPLRTMSPAVLEIGSWEGRSTIFFLGFLPGSRVTCIDTFQGNPENVATEAGRDIVEGIERRFDSNLADYGHRVEKIVSRSAKALDHLLQQGRLFDLIYIDGSHDRDDVLIDSVFSWRLLKPGGFLIWDDYEFKTEFSSPKPAIDAFLAYRDREFEEIHRGKQIIITKHF